MSVFGPHAPRQKKAGKSECCRWRVRLHTRRRACPPPWLHWTVATSSTCALTAWAWGLHPSLTWSLLGPYALAAWPGDLCLLRTWVALRSKCAPTIEAKDCTMAGRCCMVATTLVHSFIWPCNNSMLIHCTSSFLVLPSLALKPVRWMLSLHSSYLGASARVSITQQTTGRMFLAITMVHLGSFANVT